jgi:hypothetical protein
MRAHRRQILPVLLVALVALVLAAVAGAAGGRDSAVGAGTLADPNDPGGTDLSFAFAATDTSSTGVDALGVFHLRKRASNTELFGRVICLKVTGNRAVIAGVVKRASGTQPGEPVGPGDSFLAFAEDNGRGKPAVDNLSIFTFHDPAPSADLCTADESGPPAITGGNITVRDR